VSVHVASWAWKQKVGDPGLKLVLLKLADNADDAGFSWWTQKRLADECEMSRPTVQRKIKKLLERGLLVIVPRFGEDGRRVANGYRVVPDSIPPPQNDTPPPQFEGGPRLTGDAPPASQVMQQEPSVEPSKTSGSSGGGAAQLDLMGGSAASPAEKRTAASVDGKQVSRQEDSLAKAILGAFNRAFGKDFRGRDHYASIVMRIRERPDLTLEDHAALVVKVSSGERWWRGSPSPKIIYGTSKALDAALNRDESEGQDDDDGLDVYAGSNV
jgi:biotin operon repressor